MRFCNVIANGYSGVDDIPDYPLCSWADRSQILITLQNRECWVSHIYTVEFLLLFIFIHGDVLANWRLSINTTHTSMDLYHKQWNSIFVVCIIKNKAALNFMHYSCSCAKWQAEWQNHTTEWNVHSSDKSHGLLSTFSQNKAFKTHKQYKPQNKSTLSKKKIHKLHHQNDNSFAEWTLN